MYPEKIIGLTVKRFHSSKVTEISEKVKIEIAS